MCSRAAFDAAPIIALHTTSYRMAILRRPWLLAPSAESGGCLTLILQQWIRRGAGKRYVRFSLEEGPALTSGTAEYNLRLAPRLHPARLRTVL